MRSVTATNPAGRVGTRRFALSRGEAATTLLAGVVSSAAYVVGGYPYLARGVVGDLLGFLVLAAAGTLMRARIKHEALLCLVLIGVVVAAGWTWPLRLNEPVWWTLFFIGLGAYAAVRRRNCD